MTRPTDNGPDRYGLAIEQRVPALERVFGPRGTYLVSPVPLSLGGDPTLVSFPNHLPDADVWCTSEMTGGWGSGQKPGPSGEYELVMVVPKGSPLAPRVRDGAPGSPRSVTKGWVGVLLSAMATYSRDALLKHGDTAGPVDPGLRPMHSLLFVELPTRAVPFEFGGVRYGLLLCMLITEAEARLAGARGSQGLVDRLRKSKVFPVSDTGRASVC